MREVVCVWDREKYLWMMGGFGWWGVIWDGGRGVRVRKGVWLIMV